MSRGIAGEYFKIRQARHIGKRLRDAGKEAMIYLDNAATTKPDETAVARACDYLSKKDYLWRVCEVEDWCKALSISPSAPIYDKLVAKAGK